MGYEGDHFLSDPAQPLFGLPFHRRTHRVIHSYCEYSHRVAPKAESIAYVRLTPAPVQSTGTQNLAGNAVRILLHTFSVFGFRWQQQHTAEMFA